jgi:hypothetical protein
MQDDTLVWILEQKKDIKGMLENLNKTYDLVSSIILMLKVMVM